MLELIIAGGAAAWTYFKSRQFVRSRLRFVEAAHTNTAPVVAGVATALVAVPVVAVLPVVGGLTAVVLGVGVALGVAHGSRDTRRLGSGY